MKKILVLFFLACTITLQVCAQQPIDKDKVLGFFQNQQFDDALNYVLPALQADSNNLQLLGYAGFANYMNDNTDAAEKYYEHIFKIDSNNIAAIQYIATINQTEKPEKAISFTKRLLQLQPGKASNYRNLANIFRRKEQPDSAFIYYKDAYRILPGDYKNAAGLAEAFIDRELFLQADTILETALLKDSLSTPLLILRIRSAYQAEKFEEVLPPGETLVRINESPLKAMSQLALSYYKLKKYSDCIRVCEYMKYKGYALEEIYYYEAQAWAKMKEFAKSNGALKTCLTMAISSKAEEYYYHLALNYEALKQYKKAIANYDTAYYLFKNPVMNYNAGRISEVGLQNLSQAKKYYLRYLAEAKPTADDEKKAYAFLKQRWKK